MILRRLAAPDAAAMDALTAPCFVVDRVPESRRSARDLLDAHGERVAHAFGVTDEEGALHAFAVVHVTPGSPDGRARLARLVADAPDAADRVRDAATAFARNAGATRLIGVEETTTERETFARDEWTRLTEFVEMWRDGGADAEDMADATDAAGQWRARELDANTPDEDVARVVADAFLPYRYRDPWTARDAARERARAVPVGAFAPDGRLVGFASVTPPDHDETRRAYVGHVAVAPDAQGRGVGRVLARAVLDACARRAWHAQRLHVDVQNTPGLRLYKRFGWKEVTRVRLFEKAL